MESAGDLPASMPRPRLAFILVTIFLDMAGFGMVAPLLPLYVQRHSGGALLAGALGSAYAVMQVIGAPMIGSFADRHGRRPVLVACLLGSFCAYLGVGFAGSLAALFVAVAFGGLVGGSFATAQAYITDGSGPSDRTRWLGLAGAAVGLGVAAGPLLGGFLGSRGLRIPAFAASGIALGNALFGFFAIREFRRPGPVTADGRNLRVNPVSAIIDVFRRPELRSFLLTLAVLNLSFSGLPSTFPLFSQARFGWTPSANGLFFTFIGACAVLTQGFLVGRIASKVGEARLVSIGAAMAMVMFPFAAIAPAGWMLYPLLGVVAIATGLGIPSLMSLVAHAAPEAGVGRVMGGVQSVLSACLIVGPGLAGAAHQALGPPAPYWMGAGFAAAGFVIVSLSSRRGGKGTGRWRNNVTEYRDDGAADQWQQFFDRPGHSVLSADSLPDMPGPLPHAAIRGRAREEFREPGRRQVASGNRARARAEPRDPLGPEVLVRGPGVDEGGNAGAQALGGRARTAVVHDGPDPGEEPRVRDFLLEEHSR